MSLTPGETASVLGGVTTRDAAVTLDAKDNIAFAVGQECILEISDTTSTGKPIIQTATVRVR